MVPILALGLLSIGGCDGGKGVALDSGGDDSQGDDSSVDTDTSEGDTAEDTSAETSEELDTGPYVHPQCTWVTDVAVADVKICGGDQATITDGISLPMNDGALLGFLYYNTGSSPDDISSGMAGLPLPLEKGTYFAPESPTLYPMGVQETPFAVTMGDLLASQDGEEVAFGILLDPNVYVLPATVVSSTISAGQAVYTDYWAGGAVTLAAGDLNGDGQDDLVHSASVCDCVSVSWGPFDGASELGEEVTVDCTRRLPPVATATLVLSDLDGDGYTELAYGANYSDPYAIPVLQGPLVDGDEADWGIPEVVYSDGDAAGVSAPSAGDVDDDGYNDLVVTANLQRDSLGDLRSAYYLFRGPLGEDQTLASADAVLTGPVISSNNPNFQAGLAGDLTGDGTLDLVATWHEAGDHGSWLGAYDANWLGTASYEDAHWTFYGEAEEGDAEARYSWAVGDVSGDDVDDLFVSGWDGSGTLVGYVRFGGS